MKKHCNLWRNWDDIQDSYESLNKITEYFAVNASRIQPHAGPGHWNDPDMLLIGNYGLTIDQSKTQMAIWAILAAPLLMSTDLKNIRPEFREILINQPVIDVNQDELGIQGTRIRVERKIEVMKKDKKTQKKKIVENLRKKFIIHFSSHPLDVGASNYTNHRWCTLVCGCMGQQT